MAKGLQGHAVNGTGALGKKESVRPFLRRISRRSIQIVPPLLLPTGWSPLLLVLFIDASPSGSRSLSTNQPSDSFHSFPPQF